MTCLAEKRNERGTVLIIVSGIVALLGLMAYFLVVVISGRATQAHSNRDNLVAREAAKSALEYAFSAVGKCFSPETAEEILFEAETVEDAVRQFNEYSFDTLRKYGIYNLQDRNDFAHDALDITPDINAPFNSVYWGGMPMAGESTIPDLPDVDIDKLESTLEPVGAVYTCSVEERFSGDDFVDTQDIQYGRYTVLEGKSFTQIRVFGWGRVFEKIGDGSYLPKTQDILTARICMQLIVDVQLVEGEDGEVRQYRMAVSVHSTTDKKRISYLDPLFPRGWEGNCWFMK